MCFLYFFLPINITYVSTNSIPEEEIPIKRFLIQLRYIYHTNPWGGTTLQTAHSILPQTLRGLHADLTLPWRHAGF